MKVNCVSTGGAHLLAADIASGNTRSSIFHVKVGCEYLVYGVLFLREVVSYLIKNETGSPSWTPASLFEIKCGRPSRLWRLVNWSSADAYICVMTFPDLIQSQEVFDQLALGEESAYTKFVKLSRLADLEFPDPSIKETAEIVDEHWLICPFCSEASELKTLDALIRCPACQRLFNNPEYEVLDK